MKKSIVIALLAAALGASAQDAPVNPVPTHSIRAQEKKQPPTDAALSLLTYAVEHANADRQSRIDLDFPGGTPSQLVEAIKKITPETLNVIIPSDAPGYQVPPFKMKQVTVADLFSALSKGSMRKVLQFPSGFKTVYGAFERTGEGENPVWYLRSSGSDIQREETVCRYFQLGHSLEKNKIDDITTAIKTGWEMLGVTDPPQLKFHPETKLLIAAGLPRQLDLIDQVLAALPGNASRLVAVEAGSAGSSGSFATSLKPMGARTSGGGGSAEAGISSRAAFSAVRSGSSQGSTDGSNSNN